MQIYNNLSFFLLLYINYLYYMKKFLILILLLPLFASAQYPDSAKKLTPNLHALSFNSLYATGGNTSNNQVGYLDLTTGKWNGLATAYQLWLTNNTKQNTITLGTTSQYFRGDLSLATFPTGLPPTGTAGGDLTGTYPNPTVNTINSITKTYYDPTSSIQTQLNAKQNTFYNIINYGGVRDSTADNAAAFAAAVAAMPTTGGTLYIPSGKYRFDSQIIISKPITIVGDGINGGIDGTVYAPGKGGTRLYFTINNTSAFKITTYPVSFYNLDISSGVTPVSGSSAIQSTYGGKIYLNHVSVTHFYDGIRIESGTFEYTFNDVHVDDSYRYGMFFDNSTLADYGDQSITNCVIRPHNSSSFAGIYIQGGGGLKFTANKINAWLNAGDYFQYGIYINNTSGGTSVLTFTGNSIENITKQSIYIAAGQSYGNIAITGNEFYALGNYPFIEFDGNVNLGTITGNIFNSFVTFSGSDRAIVLASTTAGIKISNNSFSSNIPLANYISDTGSNNQISDLTIFKPNGDINVLGDLSAHAVNSGNIQGANFWFNTNNSYTQLGNGAAAFATGTSTGSLSATAATLFADNFQFIGQPYSTTSNPAPVFSINGSGAVTALSYAGAGTGLTGTASGLTAGRVTTNANLTGPVTSVGNATSIGANQITNTMLAGSIVATKLVGTDIVLAESQITNLTTDLANKANLSGGNSFTGNQSISGGTLKVQPSASTGQLNLELMGETSFPGYSGITTNAYYNSGWLYRQTGGYATLLSVVNGSYNFLNTASSGTAGGAITWNTALAISNTGNSTFSGNLSAKNIYSTSATPTVVVGAGAGTGASASISGNNQDGTITITTGLLTAGGILCTVTLSGGFGYPTTSFPVISSASGLVLTNIYPTGGSSTFVIQASAAVATSSTYAINYHNGGY